MYFEGQTLYTVNGPFHVLCVPTVFMCLLPAESSKCCFSFALQPLLVVLLEPAEFYPHGKSGVGFGFFFFPS